MGAELSALTTVFTETYYWITVVLMFLIHAGFCTYEVGASRRKNVLHTLMKNTMLIPVITVTFFIFGWWIYFALPNVPFASGGFSDAPWAVPWAAEMAPNMNDHITGVFWAAFTLFACTTASIFSGAVIERIRISAFVFLAVILGSVVWILAASWGWHPDGWLVTGFGFHDVAAAGCVHTVAGLFAFGVLLNLGPRVGKYNDDGSANELEGHSLVLSFVGLLTLIVGFFGFLGACLIWAGSDFGGWVNIYGAPATLSSFAFNTLMGLAGGMIGAFWWSKGNPFWMMSGGLAGIFICAGGLDIWYPGFAFILGTIAGCVIIPANNWLHNTFKIDDCVGAVSIHGVCGILGMLAVGLFASGFPAAGDIPPSNLMGQIVGIITMALTGFIPGYVISYIMKMAGWLRVPDKIQEAGIDKSELGVRAYSQ